MTRHPFPVVGPSRYPRPVADRTAYGAFTVSSLVAQHLSRDGHEKLVTVSHQPLGPVAFMVEPDADFDIRGVQSDDSGAVLTRGRHREFGDMVIVMDSGTVTEIVMHRDDDQAAAYRAHMRENAAAHEQLAADLTLGADGG